MKKLFIAAFMAASLNISASEVSDAINNAAKIPRDVIVKESHKRQKIIVVDFKEYHKIWHVPAGWHVVHIIQNAMYECIIVLEEN